jgi:hypothetical protein
MASGQVKQVDFSKIAVRPYLQALDRNANLVYVPSYAWWYLDSDGSIVLDWKRLREWEEGNGYAVVPEPFESCDEKDCYRNWLDCENFVLYPNFDVVEFNERAPYIKLRRRDNGVVFKITSLTLAHLLMEIEPGMTMCKVIPLFTGILAKLGKLTKEDMELLDKDLVQLIEKHGRVVSDFLSFFGAVPGLIIVNVKSWEKTGT